MTVAFENATTLGYRLLSKKDVASLLGYTTRTIDRLVSSKKIPFIHLPTGAGNGKKIKFDSRAIEAWIAKGAYRVNPGEDN